MSRRDNMAVEEAIGTALMLVIDPELGENIVDLGLVYEIQYAGAGKARVVMTTTTRGCPATDYLVNAAEAAASSVEEVIQVIVDLTYLPPWSPEMMQPMLKQHFGIEG